MSGLEWQLLVTRAWTMAGGDSDASLASLYATDEYRNAKRMFEHGDEHEAKRMLLQACRKVLK